MSEAPKTLGELLEGFEKCTEQFVEHNVASAVSDLVNKDPDRDPTNEELAENMAFNFCEDYSDEETGWGTYYGPMMAGSDRDGGRWETPSIKDVTEEMLDYWSNRAESAGHSLLKTRYADLVWDLKTKVTHNSPNIEMAQIVIDNTERMSVEDCHKFETSVVTKLGRALSLATAINDTERTRKLANTIVEYETSGHGHLGFSFDLLFGNEKVALSSESEKKIINDLEERLEEIVSLKDVNNSDPWTAETAATRLATYYRNLGSHDDLRRVILACGAAFERDANLSKRSLRALALMQRLHSIYLEFGLRNEAEQIAIKIRALGADVKSEMATISHEVTISNETLNEFVSAMTEGDLETTLIRIAQHYVPSTTQAEEQIREISKTSPILSLMPRQLMDDRGRTVAAMGPLEEDPTGHIVSQISQNLSFSSFMLREVMSGLTQKSENVLKSILEHMRQSPVFSEPNYEIIRRGFESYFNGDHLIAAHLLVPQFEDALRNLLEKIGGSVLKKGRNGNFQLKLLDELLRDPLIVRFLGEDLALYFRVLYTDQRGWNVRNNICHGLLPSNAIGVSITDRIVHSFFCLALIREGESSDED